MDEEVLLALQEAIENQQEIITLLQQNQVIQACIFCFMVFLFAVLIAFEFWKRM